MNSFRFIIYALLVAISFGCSKTTETFSSKSIRSYMPLEIGKFIVYNLDSTVYTNLGSKIEVRSYQIKDTIQSFTTDNLGRKVYRISRLMRSQIDSNNWLNIYTYNAIADSTRLEIIEANQRYLKLMLPIKEGFSWKGNTYINTISNPELQFLNNWEYRYMDVQKTSVSIILVFPIQSAFYREMTPSTIPPIRMSFLKSIIQRKFLLKTLDWYSKNSNTRSGNHPMRITMLDILRTTATV